MVIKNYASMLGAEKLTLSKAGAVKVQFVKETKLNIEFIEKCAKSKNIIYRFISEYEIALSISGASILENILDFFSELYILTKE